MNSSNAYDSQSAFDPAPSNESCSEQTNSAYAVDASTSQLDELPWTLSNTFFDQAIECYDVPKDLMREPSELSTTAYATAANADANSIQIPSPYCASQQDATPTSPSCSDRSSDILSYSPGRESSSQMSTDRARGLKHQMRKAGQPKPDPTASSASSASTENQFTTRIPHNMVERKYRDGLNAQMERLRRAVPALLQSADGDEASQLKPSKSKVIAAAINHIEMVTLERDMLQDENTEISKNRKESRSSKGGRESKRRRVDNESGPGSAFFPVL